MARAIVGFALLPDRRQDWTTVREIDVRHLGRERTICCWQVGEVLVDPGPEASLATLVDEIADRPPGALLLTHVHLDHAGAAGSIVAMWPQVPVYVHERGAPHLADPSKLLQSAARLYGDDMERLWGEVLPVPEENLRPLAGGETVEGFRVAYTPGHASHHVAYLHEDSGWAFVGDVAGVRIPPSAVTLAPTPPPDVDLDAWDASLDAVAAWEPAGLGLTHFGGVADVGEQLAAARQALHSFAELARGGDREAFVAALREQVGGGSDPETAAAYEQAAPFDQLWLGLERYWAKRGE